MDNLDAVFNAAVYLRISLDKTNEELGVTRQGGACRELAQRRMLPIVDTYTDNDTSAKRAGQRPEFNRLLADIEAGRVNTIIALNFDRLLRNDREKLKLMELGQKYGIRIILVRGPELDLKSATGRMMAGVLAEIARWEIELKGERHLDANLQKAQAGKPHASRRPFGYEMGYKAIRESEAKVYRAMVRRCLAGHSCKDIAHWLNRQGYVTTQGKPWWPITVRNMLRSPRYIAVRSYKGQHYPGQWEALIARDDWDMMQLLLTAKEPTNMPSLANRKYLLTGKLICGRCGNRMNGSRSRDRPGQPVRRNYVCRPVSDTGLNNGCNLRRGAEPLDAYVRDTIIYLLDSPHMAALIHGGEDDDQELRQLVTTRDRQQQLKDQLVTDYSTGLLDRQEFAQAKRKAQNELQALDVKIARHTASTSRTRLVTPGQTIREAWDEAGNDWRRRLIDLVHPEPIVVQPSQLKPFYEVDGRRYRFHKEAIHFNFEGALS